jgi:hypothetical protein
VSNLLIIYYEYQEKGGTAVSARELGVEEHAVIKTLERISYQCTVSLNCFGVQCLP